MALTLKKKDPSEPAAPKAPKPAKEGKRAAKEKTKAPRKPSGGGRGKRFTLLIGDEGAILVFMEGNKVVRRLFAPSPQPASTEAIVSLMNTHPNVPVTVLVDAIDQQFVRQSFPPVSSLSVNGLVKRRLDRDFQAEDLKGSLPLGREKTGRKEWNFLLIALAKTALLTAWLDVISELPNQLMGLYLVPVEAYNYIQTLGKAFPNAVQNKWQLLVTHNKVSGFRQVVFNNGKLVFTRVTQAIDDAIPAVIAGNIEQEIINTLEYLRRLSFQDSAGLDILVVASTDVNEVLDLKRFSMANTITLTPLEVAEGLGLDQAALSADRFGDVVLAAAFARTRKHTLRFSTAYIDALAKLYKGKLAAKAGAALLSLLLLGMSVDNIMTMSANNEAIAQSETKGRTAATQLQELKTSISGLNKNVAFKSAAVGVYDVYVKDAFTPDTFIRELAPLLTANERVLSINWEMTGKAAGSTPAAASAAAKVEGPLKIAVEFDFRGTYTDMEALSRSENAFLLLLNQKMPQYTITHETFPWEKGSDKGMEISFDQKQAESIKDGDTRLIITFVGPKKITPAPGAAAAGAAAMSGAAPAQRGM